MDRASTGPKVLYSSTESGPKRPDIVTAFKSPNYEASGFKAFMDSSKQPAGDYSLTSSGYPRVRRICAITAEGYRSIMVGRSGGTSLIERARLLQPANAETPRDCMQRRERDRLPTSPAFQPLRATGSSALALDTASLGVDACIQDLLDLLRRVRCSHRTNRYLL
jgi:hypothetical protein